MEGILIGVVILVFSAILHEISHGYVAEKLGDPTARLAGRITLNPLPHIDPVMTILVPVLLIISGSPIIFGAAKPVPVNPLMLREGRKDIALVSLAGPLTNLGLALISAILFAIFFSNLGLLNVAIADPNIAFSVSPLAFIFARTTLINLALGFLNLIPVPPLDGSKFFSIILPEKVAQQYFALAPFGIFILFLLLLMTPIGDLLWIMVLNSLNFLGF